MKDVICESTHPEDLDTGRVLAPGETASVDETHPHNARLIEEGRLTIAKPPGAQTVEEILDLVGTDPEKATAALVAEQATSRPRSTLTEKLEAIVAENPQPDEEASP